MPDPRVTIDDLPEQLEPLDSDLFIVQDSGVSKKMSVAVLKTVEPSPLTAHIADAVGAHAATAISAADSGNGINGTDVQAQLGQLSTLASDTAETLASRDVMWVGTEAPTDPVVEVWYDPDEPAPDLGVLLPYVDVRDYGAVGDGVADDTAALQAAIDAAEAVNGVVVIPPGVFKFSTLTITEVIQLRGSGSTRNVSPPFGNAQWNNSSNFGGTVLRSTATTGRAISVHQTPYTQGVVLADFMLLGPGTGTSTGLSIGHPSDGSVSGVREHLERVAVGNFDTGVYLALQDSVVNHLMVQGCNTGVLTGNNHNGNTHIGIDIGGCTNFALKMTSCDTNTFDGGVMQGNCSAGGTVVAIDGSQNHFRGIYFENPGATRGIHVGYELGAAGGGYNSIVGCHMPGTGDSIRIDANYTFVMGGIIVPAITLNGSANFLLGYFHGGITDLVPGGYNVIIDARETAISQFGRGELRLGTNKKLYLHDTNTTGFIRYTGSVLELGGGPNGIVNIGDGTTAQNSALTLNAPAANVNALHFQRGGAQSWSIYDAGSTSLFLRDQVNGVMTMQCVPGTAANGEVRFGHKVVAPASGFVNNGASGPKWLAGTGSPESAVVAPIGSLWSRTDGGVNTALYIKQTGTGNTGWAAVTP